MMNVTNSRMMKSSQPSNEIVVDTMKTRMMSLRPSKRIKKRGNNRKLKGLENFRKALSDYDSASVISGHNDEDDPNHVIQRRVGEIARDNYIHLNGLYSVNDPLQISSRGPYTRDEDKTREWRRGVTLKGRHLPIDLVARSGRLFLPLFKYRIDGREYTTTLSGIMDKVGDWKVPGRWERDLGELIWEGLSCEMDSIIDNGKVESYTSEVDIDDIHPDEFDKLVGATSSEQSSISSSISSMRI